MKKPEAIHEKISDAKKLMQKIAVWRFFNKKIVFTNGCFDILHKGHIYLLDRASEIDNNVVVIVGLNSDASVKRLKGEGRPLMNFDDRAFMISNLYPVDAVIGFEEDTPIELISLIQPDIIVKGGDYKADEVVGADMVKKNGGRVEIIPLVSGYSTTQIIQKMHES